MVNRKSNEEAVDVPGYGHILKNNVSFTFTDSSKGGHLINCDAAQCTIENNTFAPAETAIAVTADMFVSTDPATLFAPRDADGNLPAMTFLQGKEGSMLAQRQMGWAWAESDDTAIHILPDVNHHSDSPFYSLNGIPVPSNALEKGIYIHQGRMIVVK